MYGHPTLALPKLGSLDKSFNRQPRNLKIIDFSLCLGYKLAMGTGQGYK